MVQPEPERLLTGSQNSPLLLIFRRKIAKHPMLLELLKEVRTQAIQLRQTPTWSLFLALIIGAVLSWQAVEWEYKREIETLHEQRETALAKADLIGEQIKQKKEDQSKGAQVTSAAATSSSDSMKILDPQGFSELRTSNLRVDEIAIKFKKGTKPSTHTTVAAAVHGRIVKTTHDTNAVL